MKFMRPFWVVVISLLLTSSADGGTSAGTSLTKGDGEICFEAIVQKTYSETFTGYPTTVSTGNIERLNFNHSNMGYVPASAEGNELVEQADYAQWQFTKTGTTRLALSYGINFRNDAVASTTYQRFNIIKGPCTWATDGVGQQATGTAWSAHYTNTRSATGSSVVDVDKDECIGLAVETKDEGTISTLTMESVWFKIRQISTADRPCR